MNKITFQEKISQTTQEAQTTICQTKKKLNKLIEQLNNINSYNIYITAKEDLKTSQQIKTIYELKEQLQNIYNELLEG